MNHASEGDLTIAMVMVIEFIMPLLICILSMRNSLSVIVGVSALIIFLSGLVFFILLLFALYFFSW